MIENQGTQQNEKPPGRGLNSIDAEKCHSDYLISEIALPSDGLERKRFLIDNYAKFVHFSYKSEPQDEFELPQHKLDIAVEGIMHSDHLIEAREDGRLIGLFAYRLLTPSKNPIFFNELNKEYNPYIFRRWKRQKINLLHQNINAAIITEEQVVAPDKRGNSIGQLMRDKAVETLRGQIVLALGQIQTLSSLSQRFKWHGPTFFGGEIFNSEYIPLGISINEFKEYAKRIGKVYSREFNDPDYDINGIITTDLFEVPVKFPISLVNYRLKNRLSKNQIEQQEIRAFERIIKQQSVRGKKCSAIAVTILRP